MKYCVLDETKVCNDCGECSVCDLDPNKICDNCMKCVQSSADYNAIEIDEIIDDGSGSALYEQLKNDLKDGDDEPFACFKPKQYTPGQRKNSAKDGPGD